MNFPRAGQIAGPERNERPNSQRSERDSEHSSPQGVHRAFGEALADQTAPAGARLHITAMGLYLAYCNGSRVGKDELAPGYTQYRRRVQAQTLPIGGLLRPGDNVLAVLVAAADAISASRPGARRETLEKYVKRLEELEAVACGFPEVEQAYAIQAGRELRVIANAHKTSDADAVRVCRDIARAIEQQLDYPGEIKVTVIRETRSVDTAK